MTNQEAMNHAIDVLRDSQDYKMGRAMTVEAVEFLEEALAKQEQGEPVAEKICGICGYVGVKTDSVGQCPKCHWDELVQVGDSSLRSALNAMLTQFGIDEDEWNKPTFDQARKALATPQPNQEQRSVSEQLGEPVAEVKENPFCPEGHSDELTTYLPVGMKLYTEPQQRTWVGLTDEEIDSLSLISATKSDISDIEAKLKEKNT